MLFETKKCFNIEKVADRVASVQSIRRAVRVAKVILLPGLTNGWQSIIGNPIDQSITIDDN